MLPGAAQHIAVNLPRHLRIGRRLRSYFLTRTQIHADLTYLERYLVSLRDVLAAGANESSSSSPPAAAVAAAAGTLSSSQHARNLRFLEHLGSWQLAHAVQYNTLATWNDKDIVKELETMRKEAEKKTRRGVKYGSRVAFIALGIGLSSMGLATAPWKANKRQQQQAAQHTDNGATATTKTD
ncbi:hypothetical protein RI367_005517 [Sorochytrium milnesiophthora]